MKGVFKYLFLFLVLLSVLVNISGKSNEVCTFLPSTASSDEDRDYHFIVQDICPVDIFNKETNNIIPSTNNNYRLIPSNTFVCECLNNIGVRLPKVYKDVITFDIDNLATLGRNQIFFLRSLRL